MIRPRGKKFQVRVYSHRRNNRDVYLTRTADTYSTARKIERALELEVEDGRSEHADMRLDALLTRWLDHGADNLTPGTKHMYRGYIDRTINPALGDIRIGKLGPAELDRFYSKLRATMQPATIRQIHAIIRRALTVAVRWGYIRTNPASSAQPPRVHRTERVLVDPEAARAFLAEIGDPDLAMLVRLAAATGARRGELCALRWSDLDLDQGALTIRRSLSVVAGAPPVEKDTKTHQVRRLQLGAGTIVHLRSHLEAERDKARWARVRFDPRTFIFTSLPGRPWHPDALGKRYRKAAAAHGIKMGLHDWRHWAITQPLAAGHNVRQVADRSGHASTKMTHDVYSHAIPTGDQAIADTLDLLLDGEEPPA